MVLCLRSAVKQLGKWPCLCSKSGKCKIQCHFLMSPTVGKASWKLEMANSAIWSKEVLLVALDMQPKWHWSMSPAWQGMQHRPMGRFLLEARHSEGIGECMDREPSTRWPGEAPCRLIKLHTGLLVLLDPFLGHQAWQVAAAPLLWKCEISQIRLHGFPDGQPLPFNLHESLV